MLNSPPQNCAKEGQMNITPWVLPDVPNYIDLNPIDYSGNLKHKQ